MFRLSYRFGRDPENPQAFKIKNIEARIKKIGEIGRVIFFNSMTDTYHENFSDKLLVTWFELIKKYSQHTFIILTKRINRAFNFHKNYYLPGNCWIGTSIEDRNSLHRLKKLKKIEANVRFVSFEPLLENLYEIDLNGIQWVIVGGESDLKNPRYFHNDWAINIRNQCKSLGIPFFYKQHGGKKKCTCHDAWGCNLLYGKQYLEMPILLATKESKILQ